MSSNIKFNATFNYCKKCLQMTLWKEGSCSVCGWV